MNRSRRSRKSIDLLSLPTSADSSSNRWLSTRKFRLESLHADRSFHRLAVKSAAEQHVRGRTFDGNVNRESKFVYVQRAINDVGRGAWTNDRAGKRSVARHHDIRGRLLRAIWGAVGELPFPGEIMLRSILRFLRFANRVFSPVDTHNL